MGAIAFPGNPVAAINAWKEEASEPKVTAIYAERDLELATRIMMEVG